MSDQTTTPEKQPQSSGKPGRRRLILIISVVIAAVALYHLLPTLVFVFVVQPIRVEGTAMAPTLNNGDKILVSKQVGTLKRGDIVIFYYPQDLTKSFINRVIGLPGERIDVDEDGNITINGEVIKDYASPRRNQSALMRWRQMRFEWRQIKEGSYFVMGDNRDASNDSRSWGLVSKDLIYGKYLMRYWASGD